MPQSNRSPNVRTHRYKSNYNPPCSVQNLWYTLLRQIRGRLEGHELD
jgi:hypothetical protein